MDIINLIKLLPLFKKLPAPIYYYYMPPTLFPIPKELVNSEEVKNLKQILIDGIVIENFSNKVISNIRIKFKHAFRYEPLLDSIGYTKWHYDKEKKEITIDKIDPKDKISFDLFPNENAKEVNEDPKVIIDNKLLPKISTIYAILLQIPKYNPFFFTFIIIVFLFQIYLFYAVYYRMKDTEIINQTVSNFYSKYNLPTCTASIYKNKTKNIKDIKDVIKNFPSFVHYCPIKIA
ncbi:MAG: hypothetical protein HY096_07170 [Nitrospinae bacterium]|nr:hypothetical protein [Nitrospinota bacterium]